MVWHGYGTELFLSWLALALTPGLVSHLPGRLLKEFGSPEGVSGAFAAFGAIEVCGRSWRKWCSRSRRSSAENELVSIGGIENCRLVSWVDPEYPQTLLQIYDPPVLRYVRGDVQVLKHPSIGIVGTRSPT
jgi:DNA processing protein